LRFKIKAIHKKCSKKPAGKPGRICFYICLLYTRDNVSYKTAKTKTTTAFLRSILPLICITFAN